MNQASPTGALLDLAPPTLLVGVTRAETIAAVAIAVATLVIAPLLRRFGARTARRAGIRDYAARWFGRLVWTSVVLVGFFAVISVLNLELGPLIGALGLSGLVVALALQSVFGNLLGGVMLASMQPFRVGDQITTGDHVGTVIDIGTRATELLLYNGTHVYVPNSQVIDSPIINWTRESLRRTTLPLTVGYDTDLKLTTRALVTALHENPLIEDIPPPEVLAVGFGDSGILLDARFWHSSEYLTARAARDLAVKLIMDAVREHNIELAYPVIDLRQSAPDPTDDQRAR